MRRSKKGSLNLSINAIVIVVLAMVLLGLGLTFIRSMFGDITETTSTVQEQVKEQILEDLRTGDKKLSFPSQEVLVGKKDSKDLAIGIKNKNPSELKYKIKLRLINADGSEVEILNREEVIDENDNNVGKFIWNPAEQSLDINDAKVEPVKFIAGVNPETYLLKIYAITILEDDEEDEYASKTFFLTVG